MIDLTKKQIDYALRKVEDGLNQYIALQNDLNKVKFPKARIIAMKMVDLVLWKTR